MMRRGFFAKTIASPARSVPRSARCGSCGLSKGCQTPKMPVTGKGRRRVLVIAEAPGSYEDEQGTQLIGIAGRRLRRDLKRLGVDLDRDCWKTNAVCCHIPGNPTPTANQIEWCRPNVMRAIKEKKPETIVLLGGVAVESLLGVLWGSGAGSIGRWVGWRIPCQELNAWVCPTYHPSYLERTGDPVAALMVNDHLEAAFGSEGKPWEEVPDYRGRVEPLFDVKKAAKIIRGMSERGGPVAFDFETDRLKPDHPDSRIACCSVCWRGERTIAFPWHGEAVVAMRELLAGFEQKIGWNIKFEERWTRKEFGHGVTNWLWDGMETSHCLDNRRGITSAKFQAFVRLGLAPYNKEVEPYLKGEGGNGRNRIDKADMEELLIYCGIDSLVEYEIGMIQRKEMGVE